MPRKKKKHKRNAGNPSILLKSKPESQQRLASDRSSEPKILGIREIFHLHPDDPLPPFNEQTLLKYQDYLKKRLPFPFPALLDDGSKRSEGMVVELFEPDETDDGELSCLFLTLRPPEALEVPLDEVEPLGNNAATAAIREYREWRSMPDEDLPLEVEPSTAAAVIKVLVFGCLVGAALGCSFLSVAGALQGAIIGASIVTILNGLVSMSAEARMMRSIMQSDPFDRWAELISGAIYFGLFGAMAGALLLAYPGALPGGVVGISAGVLLQRFRHSLPGPIRLGIVGSYLGGIIYCFTSDAEAAWTGLWMGTAIGATTVILGLGIVYLVFLVGNWARQRMVSKS